MKRTLALALALAAALVAPVAAATGTAHADRTAGSVQTVYAHLNADQQVPSPDGAPTGARGTFSGTYNSRTRVLTWRLTWVRVSDPTTEASIHYGRAGQTGPTALTLCKPCHSPTSGHGKLAPRLAHAILQPRGEGLAYVTIDTERNPKGEIRGELAERAPADETPRLVTRQAPPAYAARRSTRSRTRPGSGTYSTSSGPACSVP